jgi:hypothetical protein
VGEEGEGGGSWGDALVRRVMVYLEGSVFGEGLFERPHYDTR